MTDEVYCLFLASFLFIFFSSTHTCDVSGTYSNDARLAGFQGLPSDWTVILHSLHIAQCSVYDPFRLPGRVSVYVSYEQAV